MTVSLFLQEKSIRIPRKLTLVITGKEALRIYVSPRDSQLCVPPQAFLNSWRTVPCGIVNCPGYCYSHSLWNRKKIQFIPNFVFTFNIRGKMDRKKYSRRNKKLNWMCRAIG